MKHDYLPAARVCAFCRHWRVIASDGIAAPCDWRGVVTTGDDSCASWLPAQQRTQPADQPGQRAVLLVGECPA